MSRGNRGPNWPRHRAKASRPRRHIEPEPAPPPREWWRYHTHALSDPDAPTERGDQ